MKKYHLYLDESETHIENKQYHFCIAGIIVEENIHNTKLQLELNELKSELWPDAEHATSIILHEKEVKDAYKYKKFSSPYLRFKKESTVKTLYTGLNKIFANNELYTIGVSISKDKLNEYYPETMRHNDTWMIALQLLLENFTHFLSTKNGEGHVFYEFINDDHVKKMKRRFYSIKNLGTMYVSPDEIQSRLLDISFPEKNDNIVGLQLADFVPNNIARKHAKMSESKNMTLQHVIFRKAYDGGINERTRFGIKMIP